VTLHANSITDALYKNKFELRRERERSVSTAVSTPGQTMTKPESIQISAKY